MPKSNKRKLGKFILVNKKINELDLNEITTPRHSGKYRGTSVGRDKSGFFVATHRVRSSSYLVAGKIPEYKIKFVRSTG